MHLITAIIKPHRLEAVTEALKERAVGGLTVSDVQGFGRQGGHSEVYRGSEYHVDYLPKIRVEVICADADSGRDRDAHRRHGPDRQDRRRQDLDHGARRRAADPYRRDRPRRD